VTAGVLFLGDNVMAKKCKDCKGYGYYYVKDSYDDNILHKKECKCKKDKKRRK
jgi:hypothetical protein